MNYELAKKLKDAGFPQKFRPFLPTGNTKEDIKGNITYPTLEELIEACGEDFGVLYRWKEGNIFPLTFTAWQKIGPECEGEGLKAEGSTPLEAVVNLWLSVKSHQTEHSST